MSIELVIHAPNAQALARAALPWLAQAQFVDSAPALMAAIRGAAKQSFLTQLRVLDVFGPNPDHPLQDQSMLGQLRMLLAPRGAMNVVALNIHPPQAGSFGGGQFAGFGGSADKIVSAGFSGFSGSGFGGLRDAAASGFSGGFGGFGGAAEDGVFLPYLAAARAALGDRFRVRTVSSLAQARQSWDI